MISKLYCIVTLIFILSCTQRQPQEIDTVQSFTEDSIQITNVLNTQVSAWNNGDIESFMQGYWNDENTTFIGSSGITYGWQNVLDNYKKGYPDLQTMGKLEFDIVLISSLGPKSAQVLGQYKLTREHDRPSGFFSLIFQNINGQWVITSDMTAATPIDSTNI